MAPKERPTPYAEREEWSDLTPIPQHDTIQPMAPIFYTDEYKEATSYFRALVKAGEHSQRGLDLMLHIISLNPAHYTVWQYRWETLLALKSDLLAEQTLMESIATEHLKTYQVWHHRRLLLTHLGNPIPELLFLVTVLQVDAKNYHTWAYRQWILAQFGGELDERTWLAEMDFVEEMLDQDVRNNSAWSHRFFVVWASGVRTGEEDRMEVLRREARYTKSKISLAPNNAAAWNYLRGILDHTHKPYSLLIPFAKPYTATTFTPLPSNEIDLDNPAPGQGAQLPCVYAIEFVADALAKDAVNVDGLDEEGDKEGLEEKRKEAIEKYKSLALEYDKSHKNYWNYRISEVSQLGQLQSQASQEIAA